MMAGRRYERCGAPLDGRRPEARFCCRRAPARKREPRRAPLATDPAQTQGDGTSCHAPACEAALRRLEYRLDELATPPSDADARVMARVLRDALREDGSDR